MSKSTNQQGFTILELLIATMVFSVIFVGATTAILQIGKLYYKGVVTNRVQETTRAVSDSLSQQMQFSDAPLATGTDRSYTVNGAPSNSMTFSVYCVGSTRLTYVKNAQVSASIAPGTYDGSNNLLAHALWRDTINQGGPCVPADLSRRNPTTDTAALPSPSGKGVSDGTELLGVGMRLTDFQLACDSTTKICTVGIAVIYGDNDLMAPDSNNPTHCASVIGNQWCASSQLTTTVLKRVGTVD